MPRFTMTESDLQSRLGMAGMRRNSLSLGLPDREDPEFGRRYKFVGENAGERLG